MKELKCLSCGSPISSEKQNTCIYCQTIDSENGEPVFCDVSCFMCYHEAGEVSVQELES